eukprot:GHVU01137778.1.p1 GENE.GHVU01137778.1~~GHVU01137778.1.p1  ORF type:complete len:619 (+),score=38.48 GHVU01137778.1:1171-3027(+)
MHLCVHQRLRTTTAERGNRRGGDRGTESGTEVASSSVRLTTESSSSNETMDLARFSGLLQRIHANMRTLPQDVAREVLKGQSEQTAAESVATERAVVVGRSLEELVKNCGLTHRPDAGVVECAACVKWSSSRTTPGETGIAGQFKTAQDLNHLRTSIARHLAQDSHKNAVEKDARMRQRERNLKHQGMANGRAVYLNVKEARPFVSYERLILMLELSGVDVGTINHGRNFAKGLVTALRNVIMDRIRTYLDTPSPAIGMRKPAVAVAADKSTHLRRTTQLVTATVMVNGAMECVMVDRHVVPPHRTDGQGVGGLVVESTLALMPLSELRQRVAAFAFDGQYVKDNVGLTLRRAYGGTPRWLTIRWDSAHKVELVLEDLLLDRQGSEELDTVAWLGTLPATTCRVLARFQWGKHYEEIRDMATELEFGLRNPNSISGTRFVKSATKAYKNVQHNFRAYVQAYTDASTIPPDAKRRGGAPRIVRNEDEQSAFDTLTLLTDQLYIGYLLVVTDLYGLFTEVGTATCPCMHVHILVCPCTWSPVHTHARPCPHLRLNACARTYTQLLVPARPHICTLLHAQTLTRTCTYLHALAHPCACTHMHAFARTLTCTCVHLLTRSCT